MLELRKKGNKHWLLIDEEIGEFTPSKFTINRLNSKIEVVYFNNLKSKNYDVSDCYIFDIDETIGFNTSSGVEFMDKLEELNCPCFQKDVNNFYISGGSWSELTNFDSLPDADLPLLGTEQIAIIQDGETKKLDLSTKLDKVSTSGVERAYIINADGSQGTKATSEFKDVLEFADFASFPVTGETGIIYVALDTNKTYRWTGSVYVQIGGTTKKTENLFFQDAVGSTVKTITADQKNMHQSRFLANASPYGVLGLTFGNGIPETSGVINLSYLSDYCVAQITGDYIGKVQKVIFTYARNVVESAANTNVVIRVMAETKYNTDMQLIAEHNLVSTTTPAFAENKIEIPVLTHLPLSAFSNIKWCIRSNNATAQQFGIIKINVIIEEV